jgi:hypothetical protein
MHWLRLHHDTPNDPKWRLVAIDSEQPVATVLAVWMNMLVCASASSDRGTLENWNDRIVGASIDVKGEAVSAIRNAMQGIVLEGDRLTGWDKRQRASDNVAERVKKHRKAKNTSKAPPPDSDGGGNAGNGSEGYRNGAATLQTGDVTLQTENVTLPSLTRKTPDSQKEESGEDSGGVDSNPPRAGAREEPPPPVSSNVVSIDSGPKPVPLPEGWVLPEEWRRWALNARWPDPDGSAEKFRNWYLAKWERGDGGATFTEAGWRRQWEEWINGDLKRAKEQANGAGRNTHRRRDGGLAAVIVSDYARGVINPESGSDGW